MNNDLISREALKKDIEQWFVKDKYYTNRWHNKMPKSEVLDVIDNAPTVEEIPQGEWIKIKEEMFIDMIGEIVTRYECSVCGRKIATIPSLLVKNYPFCHCGAEMKGGAK